MFQILINAVFEARHVLEILLHVLIQIEVIYAPVQKALFIANRQAAYLVRFN